MTLIKAHIEEGKLPEDPAEAKKIKWRSCKHTIIEGHLFKRGIYTPLLKSIDIDEVGYALEEVYEGIASQHLRGIALARKLLRAGYYWPTMKNDSMEYVKRCDKGTGTYLMPHHPNSVPLLRRGPLLGGGWTF